MSATSSTSSSSSSSSSFSSSSSSSSSEVGDAVEDYESAPLIQVISSSRHAYFPYSYCVSFLCVPSKQYQDSTAEYCSDHKCWLQT